MDKPVILVADDDELLIKVLQRELEREGYDVLSCFDGERALELARYAAPDLILLDVMMPKRNGWEVCREVRAESNVPIIMLTARGEEMDKVMGLRLGSDDYVVKPFGLFELLARIEAILRRVRMNGNGQPKVRPACEIQLGNVEIDTARRTVKRAGESVYLAFKEFDLLAALLDANGAVVERDILLDQVWGEDWVGDTRTLDVHIRRLRAKIEADPAVPELILTVRNVGYRMATAEEI
ncbi:MAG: response regulator transcription factor [Caldilineaceae bacterium]